MKFGKRLDTLESNSHVCEYTPPIIIHTIVEPSESGPKEIGVFAMCFWKEATKELILN